MALENRTPVLHRDQANGRFRRIGDGHQMDDPLDFIEADLNAPMIAELRHAGKLWSPSLGLDAGCGRAGGPLHKHLLAQNGAGRLAGGAAARAKRPRLGIATQTCALQIRAGYPSRLWRQAIACRLQPHPEPTVLREDIFDRHAESRRADSRSRRRVLREDIFDRHAECRWAASRCLTERAATSRVGTSLQVMTCTEWTAAIEDTPTHRHPTSQEFLCG
jgi:hypothetical protein